MAHDDQEAIGKCPACGSPVNEKIQRLLLQQSGMSLRSLEGEPLFCFDRKEAYKADCRGAAYYRQGESQKVQVQKIRKDL